MRPWSAEFCPCTNPICEYYQFTISCILHFQEKYETLSIHFSIAAGCPIANRLHRCTLYRTSPGPVNTIDTKVNGNTLKDYADAIIEVGRFYSCPVIDMYSISGINRSNLKKYTFEGVHPTNEAYVFTSWPIIETFKNIGVPLKK